MESIDSSCSSVLHVTHELGYWVRIHFCNRQLVTYHYGGDKARPFIHPLYTLSGETITLFEPFDHPWHRGMWFAWKYVNDVNFWEERVPWVSLPKNETFGRIVTQGTPNIEIVEKSVNIDSRLLYVSEGSRSMLEETCSITVHAPDKPAYMIDWNAGFAAIDREVYLSSTPISRFSWGGYGGLGIRVRRDLGNGQVRNSEGEEIKPEKTDSHSKEESQGKVHGENASWCSISGMLDATGGAQAGIALFDHPSNPRHPTPWHVATGQLGYIGTAFLRNEDYRLTPGKPLNLRYRIVVFDGETDPTTLSHWYEQYSQGVN